MSAAPNELGELFVARCQTCGDCFICDPLWAPSVGQSVPFGCGHCALSESEQVGHMVEAYVPRKRAESVEDALIACRAQLGDRVRDGSACDDEKEAYEEANKALGDKAVSL